MKWWHWLILELLIIFGVMAWIYFFPSDFEVDFAKGMIGFVLIYAIEKCRDINRRKTMTSEELDRIARAEEIAKDIYIHYFDDDINYPCVLQAITAGVQKGAEYGYKKALEEATHNYNAIIADYDKRIAELAKANEWHYPSKGELPENNKLCLIQMKTGTFEIAYRVTDLCWKYKNTTFSCSFQSEIYAWKEIVFSKEIKEK